jgi:hypothetical protein
VMDRIDAMTAPTRALVELVLALIGHMHDKGLIDRHEIGRLLEARTGVLASNNADDPAIPIIESQINWLMRLGSGMPEPS